ncbi:MAG: hypothetical protein IT364_00225 [Candidatus Hydrogenedentes bacterium]|nr:hypothetical protein [Candidatus Hydrogenedentota bacterium]
MKHLHALRSNYRHYYHLLILQSEIEEHLDSLNLHMWDVRESSELGRKYANPTSWWSVFRVLGERKSINEGEPDEGEPDEGEPDKGEPDKMKKDGIEILIVDPEVIEPQIRLCEFVEMNPTPRLPDDTPLGPISVRVSTTEFVPLLDIAFELVAERIRRTLPNGDYGVPWGAGDPPKPESSEKRERIIKVLCARDSDREDIDSIASLEDARRDRLRPAVGAKPKEDEPRQFCVLVEAQILLDSGLRNLNDERSKIPQTGGGAIEVVERTEPGESDTRQLPEQGEFSSQDSEVPVRELDSRESEYMFQKRGDGYLVRFCGKETVVKVSKGADLVYRLICSPNQTFPMEDFDEILKADPDWLNRFTSEVERMPESHDDVHAARRGRLGIRGDRLEATDRKTIQDMKEAISDLEDRKHLAESRSDIVGVEEIEEKIGKLKDRLSKSTNLRGSPRLEQTYGQRLIKRLNTQFRRFLDNLPQELDGLVRHLESTIQIDETLSYTPYPKVEWRI